MAVVARPPARARFVDAQNLLSRVNRPAPRRALCDTYKERGLRCGPRASRALDYKRFSSC